MRAQAPVPIPLAQGQGLSQPRAATGEDRPFARTDQQYLQGCATQLTTNLVRGFAVIGIEDLNVRGMMANDRLARSIADIGFYEFRRQLGYKAAVLGCRVAVASRWFPSFKTCADCGSIVDALPMSIRAWDCAACGAHHDRDLNALATSSVWP